MFNRGFLFILILMPFFGNAQNDFRHLSWKDGLSSNKTYQSVEDTNGFIWISTDEGVDRFDGKNFTHYNLEKHEEIANSGYLFYRVLIDGNDNLFIVSNRGHVFILNRKLDKFDRLIEFEEYYGRYVFSALIDQNQNLLLGIPNGIIVYNYSTKEIFKTEFSKNAYSIVEFEDGFIVGGNSTLYKLASDFKKSEKLGSWNSSLGNDIHLRSLLHDLVNNRIWFGTQKVGLNYFDLFTQKYYKSGLSDELHEFPIWDIVLADQTTMLVGTDGAGITKVDLDKLEITDVFSANADEDKAISSNVIHDILVCKNSTYIITSNLGGLNILNPKPVFNSLKNQITEVNTLRNNVVHSIVELKDKKIAFGTDKGVSLLDTKTNKWSHIGGTLTNEKNNVVTSMTTTKRGDLLVGYFLKETELILEDGSVGNLPEVIALSKNSKAMYFDDERNAFWMGHEGQSKRLLSYDFDTDSIHTFAIEEVSCIVSHTNNKLLVGTNAGLYLFDKESYVYLKLNSYRVTSLLVAANNKVWIGTNGGGVTVIDINSNDQFNFNDSIGLASSRIYSIIEDNEDLIWATTEVGLSRIDPKTKGVINYYESDGIASVDFMYTSICKTSDGLIYAGSTGGVTIFNPKTLLKPSVTNNLVFTTLYINQNKIVADSSLVLSKPLNNTEKIELAYDQNSFILEFSNIDLIHPEQARYIWKLEGVDGDWTNKTQLGRAVYSNLRPGNYIFRVRNQASYVLGDNIGERKLLIQIQKPFWKSPFAYIIYTLIIIALILLGLYYNKLMHDVRSSKERLKFLVNLAHEIKTPLSLIRAPIGDLLQENTSESANEKLSMAMTNVEKLQKRIGQFLDFRRVNQIVNVHTEKVEIVEFLQNKIFAFNLLAERNKIKLNIESTIQKLFIYSDTELLDKIINNLLSNAIKYNKPGGFINIRMHQEDGLIKISVADSGIGIPKKEQKNIFKLFFRASTAIQSNKSGSGVGLVLTRDMVKVLKGKLTFKSKDGQGTTFYLVLPIGETNVHEDESIMDIEPVEIDSIEEDQSISDFKVLVAEDDDDLRGYIKQQLQKHYSVIEAKNGQLALDIAKQKLPDLILSDVAMPQMNGRQLCMNIKSQPATSHIPVILLSGLDSKDNVLRGLSAGADDYVSKPFDSSILMAKIENLLNNRKELKDKFLQSDQWTIDVDFENEHDKNFLNQITNLVEENISDSDLSIKMLLTAVGMSRTAFYHKLKSLIDLSPAEFIRSVRLNKAKELLRSNKYHINEVAYRCGFSDSKYFSTSFKRQFGQSPSSYISELVQ